MLSPPFKFMLMRFLVFIRMFLYLNSFIFYKFLFLFFLIDFWFFEFVDGDFVYCGFLCFWDLGIKLRKNLVEMIVV
jgi:hypothetical protein